MGTRAGDVDPSVLTGILTRDKSMTAEELDRILNKESGLVALGGSNDMRDLEQRAESGDDKATLAIDMAAYRLAKYIGGYHVAVGGMKALIFTAGIGENSPEFRQLVVDQLRALDIHLDDEANQVRSGEIRVISTSESAIPVLVVPTDEERAIAEATAGLVTARIRN